MRITLFFLNFILFYTSIFGLTVGSYSSVTWQSATTFPASATDNLIQGFVYMESGFTLADPTTSCTYRAVFPVDGTINVNGGKFYLLEDFVTQSLATVGSPGYFYGGNRTMHLKATLPMVVPTAGVNAAWEVAVYTSSINVSTVDWDYTGSYVVYGANNGVSNTFGILGFDGSTLTSLIANTTIPTQNLNSIRCHPSMHYFALGINGGGSYPAIQIWEFDPSGPTLTQKGTDLAIANRNARAVSWHPLGNYVAAAVNKIDATTNATIYVYPFNSGTGTLGVPITATVANSPTFGLCGGIDWAPEGNYLVVGVGVNAGTELQIYYFDGATLTFTLGAEIGQQVNVASWAKTGSFILIGQESSAPSSAPRLNIYEHSVQNGTLSLVTTVTSGVGSERPVFATGWRVDGNAFVGGRSTGSGPELFIRTFNKATKTEALVYSIDEESTVYDARWSPSCSYVVHASSGATKKIDVHRYADGSTCLFLDPLVFNNISLLFDSDILFKVPVVVQGNCIFDGRHNHVAFGPDSSLRIDSGALLLCKSLTMTTMSTSKLIMTDNTSSISLQGVQMVLDEDLTFSQGYLICIDDVSITGTAIFTYASSRQAIIESHATLFMDGGITFSYAPPTASGSLFGFRDATSVWHVNDVTLHSTTTGLQLTKGIFRVSGDCRIENEASSAAEGIQFGNGSAADNVTVDVLSGAGIDVISGYLVYNNA